MERFSAKQEQAHDALMMQVRKNLDHSNLRMEKIDREISEISERSAELLNEHRDNDDVVEQLSAAISAKAQSRQRSRLARKFSNNPMPGKQKQFAKLAGEAEAFIRVSKHHLNEAEKLLPSQEFNM